MKPELIAQLEKLNEEYPFRPFELETLEGRRIRVVARFRKLYGDKGGDFMTAQGSIEVLSYANLKDAIYMLPPWKYPLRWLYDRPHWFALAMVGLVCFLMIIGSITTVRTVLRTPQQSDQPVTETHGRATKPLSSATETINGNTVTTIRSGDFFTRIIKTPEGQSFVEEGYVNFWGEYHVTEVTGGTHK